ncbi:MAG: phosphate acyltransferase [Muribaculaceae bacterium]
MQFIKDFTGLKAFVKASAIINKVRVVAVCPHDDHTREAIEAAINEGLAEFTLVGSPDKMGTLPSLAAHLIEEADTDRAAYLAVEEVRQGRADVMMKGLINTDNLLRAVLNKEHGLLPAGKVLTHITAAEVPGRHKLLFFSDAAVIPFPKPEQRTAQVGYLAQVCRAFGIEQPRIALIHCTEKISPKFPVTLDYQMLKQQCAEGLFGCAIVDGPMDAKTAVDIHSAQVKGIDSPIGGDADALLMPDIESGNVFYKALTCFAHASIAGMLMGANCPVVLPSRGDSTESKLCSLAMACATAIALKQ